MTTSLELSKRLWEKGLRQKCTWTRDDDDIWDTNCGHTFLFNEGTVEENEFQYCPFCGREIEVKHGA